MKILQIMPGTGSFLCGSCLRDVALVQELRRRNHEVPCIPLYLPLVTETFDPTDCPIFFGGIKIFLQQISPLFRLTPHWMNRWLDHPALLRWVARRSNMTAARTTGALTLSMLRGNAGNHVKEINRLVSWIHDHVKPDLICLSNALLVGMAPALKAKLHVPVVCTLQGEDSFLDSLPDPFVDQAWQTLREQAEAIDLFIPVSHYYRKVMQSRLGLAPEKLRTVYNGLSFDDIGQRQSMPEPPVIGYLARLFRAKGLDTLVRAYMLIRRKNRIPDVRLHIGGVKTRGDEAFVAGLENRLAQAGLASDVRFMANLSRPEKFSFLQALSVFSVPATYGEAFGLYVIEALGCGVPVVQPNHGAFPELIEATKGGILCQPDNPGSLAEALTDLLLDRENNQRLGSRGRDYVRQFFTIEKMTDEIMAIYDELVTSSMSGPAVNAH